MSSGTQKPASPQEAWQAQAARLALLSEVVLLIAKTPDLDRLLSVAVNKIKWVIDFQRCTLALVNDDGGTYRIQPLMDTRRDHPKDLIESIPLQMGVPGVVIQSGRMRVFSDFSPAGDKPSKAFPTRRSKADRYGRF